jgi:hypothetical protein
LAVAMRLAQPVLSKNIVNARATDLRNGFMLKNIIQATGRTICADIGSFLVTFSICYPATP